MFFRVWAGVAPFTRNVRARTIAIVLWSLLGGATETYGLMVAVKVAVAVGADQADAVPVPFIDAVWPAWALIISALVAALVALGSHVIISRLSARMTASVLANTRKAAMSAFVNASWEVQSVQREGALQETVTTLSRNTSAIAQNLVATITNAIMLVVFIIVALVTSPLATVVIVIVGAALAAALRPIARATRRAANRFTRAGARYAESIGRFSSTSMEYKVFGVQGAAQTQLAAAVDGVANAQQRSRFFSMLGSNMFRDVAVVLLIVAIGGLVLLPDVDPSAVLVVITLVVRALASAQAVNTSNQGINEAAPNLVLFRERLTEWQTEKAAIGSAMVPDRLTEIEFRGAEYHYPGSDRGVGPLDLLIKRGEAIGVIGKSGAGKSTFVQMLLRLRPPSSGIVELDGIDYRGFSDASWAHNLGFVPQEPSLLEASIADNIDFSRGVGREAVERAAHLAHVYDDISALPNGFDTVLGPRGSGLSGGQKQRVAIARALAGQPKLLVLDEPSSALDQRSEALLAETLAELKGSTTLVIVAHRLTTIRDCDRFVVFEGGRITQVGTPDELLRAEGYYRSLFVDTDPD